MPCDYQRIIKIWQGFSGLRPLLAGLSKIKVEAVTQQTVETFLPGSGLQLRYIPRKELCASISKQLEADTLDDKMREELEAHKRLLLEVKDDLHFEKSTEDFDYEFIFKPPEIIQGNMMRGFAKAKSRKSPIHAALLSWEDNDEPIFFLAELEVKELRFHIDYGKSGFALIEELADSYRWTHCAVSGYDAMKSAEFGYVLMSKTDGALILEQGNLAAAQALSRAKSIGKNGKTLLENNIELVRLYRNDLEKLIY